MNTLVDTVLFLVEMVVLLLAVGVIFAGGIRKFKQIIRGLIPSKWSKSTSKNGSIAEQSRPVRTNNLVTTNNLVVTNNTLILGKPGSGKSHLLIKLMQSEVKSMQNGGMVYWLNPHLTLYHPKDQPIDLRPIQNNFLYKWDYGEIMGVTEMIVSVIKERMALYRAGKDVGSKVLIFMDEIPAIVEVCGQPIVNNIVSILREGRKANVWLVMSSQDALVSSMGVKTGARNIFETVLMSWDIDNISWRAFSSIPKPTKPLPIGSWYDKYGVIHTF